MTNAKVYQGFHDDKKVEEHWFRTCNRRSFSFEKVFFWDISLHVQSS